LPYIEERLARIEAQLSLPPYTPTPVSNAPYELVVTENSDGTTTAEWKGSSTSYEVHENLADPSNTLKAIVTTTYRVSTKLVEGNTYEYVIYGLDNGVRTGPSNTFRFVKGSGTPPTTEEPTTPPSAPKIPGQKFNLSRWYLTLPIASTDGSDTSGPWDIYNPRLQTFVHPRYFYLDDAGNLKLEAPVKGVTTSSASGATRDEFREETADGQHASWNATSATRDLIVTMTCDPTSVEGRKEAIVGQIHAGGGTPPVYLAVNHNSSPGKLSFFKNGPSAGDLITGLLPNEPFTYRILVSGGRCKIYAAKGFVVPTTPKFDFPASDFNETTGCYFKAGAYNKQSISSATTGSTFVTMYRMDLV
jgi:hypothetical protein